MAKADCQRAMDLAHRLSSELRAAEEKAREFEAEANYFRDRATHAEEWLVRIHSEIQQTFFQNKDQPKPQCEKGKGTHSTRLTHAEVPRATQVPDETLSTAE